MTVRVWKCRVGPAQRPPSTSKGQFPVVDIPTFSTNKIKERERREKIKKGEGIYVYGGYMCVGRDLTKGT